MFSTQIKELDGDRLFCQRFSISLQQLDRMQTVVQHTDLGCRELHKTDTRISRIITENKRQWDVRITMGNIPAIQTGTNKSSKVLKCYQMYCRPPICSNADGFPMCIGHYRVVHSLSEGKLNTSFLAQIAQKCNLLKY